MQTKEYWMGVAAYSPEEVLNVLESDDLKEKFEDLLSLGCQVRTLQFEENDRIHVDFNITSRNESTSASTSEIHPSAETFDDAVKNAYEAVVSLGKPTNSILVAKEARYKGQDIACFRYNGRKKMKFGL